MNKLKQLRTEADESQEYVGTLIGVSGQAVGQYELGKRGLSQDKIIILANHYNCSTDYLLGKSDIRNPQNVNLDEMDIAFASGIKGLNKENQQTLKNIMDGLLAKQKIEEEKGGKK